MSEVIIPENIEELIAAYLKQQAARFPGDKMPAMLSVDISASSLKVCGWVTGCDVEASTESTLKNAVSIHLEKIVDHDPIGERLAKIRKLQDEVLALEAGGNK